VGGEHRPPNGQLIGSAGQRFNMPLSLRTCRIAGLGLISRNVGDQLQNEPLQWLRNSRIGLEEIGGTRFPEVPGLLPEQRTGRSGIVDIADQILGPAAEGMGDFNEPREADPIGASLIFLDLLKC
jgi:hypothetical protein